MQESCLSVFLGGMNAKRRAKYHPVSDHAAVIILAHDQVSSDMPLNFTNYKRLTRAWHTLDASALSIVA